MNLTAEHNLTPEELAKALYALAEAEGVSEELAKAIGRPRACDETPKEPQHPAPRHLYHLLQQEFTKAIRDIERYAREMQMGRLAKADVPRPLTPEQLRQLQQTISDRFEYIAAQLQSVDYQPPADLLDRWQKLGLVSPEVTPATFMATVPAEMHFVRNAFLMGKLIDVVESGKSYEEVMHLARTTPLLAPDVHAIAVAEQQTANFITNAAADLATEAGKLWAKKQAETVRNMAIDYHNRTLPAKVLDAEEKVLAGDVLPQQTVDTWRGFSSELYHALNDKARDWDRVAFYELTDAQKQGQAAQLLAEVGTEGLVYKMPLPTACAQCRHLYLMPDGVTPRVFRLSDMIRNGANIGRKAHPVKNGKVQPGGRVDGAETLKAVAGLVHPWCACKGPYPVSGHEPWLKAEHLEGGNDGNDD